MIFKKFHDFKIFVFVLRNTLFYFLCMVKYWLRYTVYNDKVNLVKDNNSVKRDDDVMGSHASLWLWNRATWEKLNSLESQKRRRKIFPDSSENEKREISEMDNIYVIIWIAIYASIVKVLGLLEKLLCTYSCCPISTTSFVQTS